MVMTQFDKILQYLRTHGHATYRELILNGGGNWPHKRVDEHTGRGGEVYEQVDGKYRQTGERIVREKRRFRGRDLTVLRLKRP